MFPNCIDRLDRQKEEQNNNKQTKKNQGKIRKQKMEIIAPTMNHFRGMDRKEIMNFPPDKFLISVYKICLYATLPPSGLYRL